MTPSKVRNTLLVIVILITAATYQPALAPPGGTREDDYVPSTVNNNSSSATSNITAIKPHTTGQSIMLTHNPIAYNIFLSANSVGFYMSLYMILVLTTSFPMRMELHVLVFALSTTYSTCINAIAPHSFVTYVFFSHLYHSTVLHASSNHVFEELLL
ncbi:putative PGG domain-containing protein [Helianthus debilis subsp. tardiflorus]